MPECTCVWTGVPNEQHDEQCPREQYLRERAETKAAIIREYDQNRPA